MLNCRHYPTLLPSASANALGNLNYFAQSPQNGYHFKRCLLPLPLQSERKKANFNKHLLKRFFLIGKNKETF
jgi:hypothetical protein